MQVYRNISEIDRNKDTVLTVGTFDGFHLGHKKIIEQVICDAKRLGGRSLIITFEPHPRSVIAQDYDLRLLTSTEEKIDLISKAGVENILIIKFTKQFSMLSADEFVKEYIVGKIGIKELVVGYDHRFGKDRIGDEKKLEELSRLYSFNILPVDAVKINGDNVNSTKIRNYLYSGKLDKANEYLGRYYSFSGKIVSGSRRGRTLGFPTANIELNEKQKLIPSNGIYVVEFFVHGKKYFGLMNIGTRPTFDDSTRVVIEVYLYDFNQDIYGEDASVNIIHRLRDEIKYSDKEALIKQMEKDKINGKRIIESIIN